MAEIIASIFIVAYAAINILAVYFVNKEAKTEEPELRFFCQRWFYEMAESQDHLVGKLLMGFFYIIPTILASIQFVGVKALKKI